MVHLVRELIHANKVVDKDRRQADGDSVGQFVEFPTFVTLQRQTNESKVLSNAPRCLTEHCVLGGPRIRPLVLVVTESEFHKRSILIFREQKEPESYLKTQLAPRSKHSPSRLQNQSVNAV